MIASPKSDRFSNHAIVALLPLVLLVVYVLLIQWMMAPDIPISPMAFAVLQVTATIFLLLLIASVCFVYYALIVNSQLSETIKNLVLSFTTVLVFLFLLECFFLHYERSEAVGTRWSYKMWDKKFMSHRVYFSYRGLNGNKEWASFREPVFHLKKKKNMVWFIGDSFTFGFGLENTNQTFPWLVEEHLKGKLTSVNLGDGGADTYHEKDNLYAFEHEEKQMPDVVVWQYFGNDIDSDDIGPDLYEKELSKSNLVKFARMFFRGKSFLLDYIYWEYFAGTASGWVNTYNNFLAQEYLADSMVVNGVVLRDSIGLISPYRKHLMPLIEAAAYYKCHNVKFLVIIFPYLWKDGPENAERLYTNRREKDMRADNTDVINITPLVKDIPVEKRIVNIHDPHPSVFVDRIVADTIAKYFVSKYGM